MFSSAALITLTLALSAPAFALPTRGGPHRSHSRPHSHHVSTAHHAAPHGHHRSTRDLALLARALAQQQEMSGAGGSMEQQQSLSGGTGGGMESQPQEFSSGFGSMGQQQSSQAARALNDIFARAMGQQQQMSGAGGSSGQQQTRGAGRSMGPQEMMGHRRNDDAAARRVRWGMQQQQQGSSSLSPSPSAPAAKTARAFSHVLARAMMGQQQEINGAGGSMGQQQSFSGGAGGGMQQTQQAEARSFENLLTRELISHIARSGQNSVLHANFVAELDLIWAADKRMPSLASRRTWASRRGVNPAVVINWFQRKRYNDGSRIGVRLPGGTYDLLVGEDISGADISDGMSLRVKRERAESASLALPKRQIPAAGPVRHTRAHDTKPNLQCLICSQLHLASAIGESTSTLFPSAGDLPKDSIEVKLERAISPLLSVSRIQETRKTRVVSVKRERDASPVHILQRPRKKRKPNPSQARVQVKATLQPIRHTRAHDLSPNPECPICSQKSFVPSAPLSPILVRLPQATRASSSPTPALTSAMPSSDFDFDSRLSTPTTYNHGRRHDTPPKTTSSAQLDFEDLHGFTFWPGIADADYDFNDDLPKKPKPEVHPDRHDHRESDAYTQDFGPDQTLNASVELRDPHMPCASTSCDGNSSTANLEPQDEPPVTSASVFPSSSRLRHSPVLPPRYRRMQQVKNAERLSPLAGSDDSSANVFDSLLSSNAACSLDVSASNPRFAAPIAPWTGLDLLADVSLSISAGIPLSRSLEDVVPLSESPPSSASHEPHRIPSLKDVTNLTTPTDLPPPTRPQGGTPSRPGSPERPAKPIRPASHSQRQLDIKDANKENTVIPVKSETLDDVFPPDTEHLASGSVLDMTETVVVDPFLAKTEPSAVRLETANARRVKPKPKSKVKPKPKVDPISSRTKRALGLPGRSIRVATFTANSKVRSPAKALLSVLLEMQAYDRVCRRFPSSKTKSRLHGDERFAHIVRLDRPTSTRTSYHPPRMVAYDALGLKAFEKVKWEAGVRKVTTARLVRFEPPKVESWELSAVPWLAAVGSGGGEAGQEEGEGDGSVFEVPDVMDLETEMYVALYSQVKVSEETERAVWGAEGLLGVEGVDDIL
ncbi:hypothetical protein EUX98_g7076 [Antrodiella citrinella]|uniref:Homeobox domain-containing protein n=1 Tax=Antrodiella citrinella TaxID=2447956 RepID=A0A4S4MPY1_9APHY|nr:hypothetical protein EUX98_g7076 [Antrodiella citrinella]